MKKKSKNKAMDKKTNMVYNLYHSMDNCPKCSNDLNYIFQNTGFEDATIWVNIKCKNNNCNFLAEAYFNMSMIVLKNKLFTIINDTDSLKIEKEDYY